MIDRRTLLHRTTITCWVGATLWSSRADSQPERNAGVRVAAASDLRFALPQIAAMFQKDSGQVVTLSFGSSGNFAQQIAHGLAVDLFLSADESYVFRLAAAGLTRLLPQANGAGDPVRDPGTRYATGRVALLLARSSSIALDAGLVGLAAGWHQVLKFAIADPQHAPYGRAARQALVTLGLWEMVRPKLVFGENIAQATQFVTSGAAQAGITALSLALAPQVGQGGKHIALPEQLHDPLHQRMVLLKSASPGAVAFHAYLQGARARAALAQYGFAQT